MTQYQPVFSEEMLARLPGDVYEYVKAGTLTEMKVIGVSREILKIRDDKGDFVYYNIKFPDKKTAIILDTMIGRIRLIVQHWKKYLAPQMQTMIVEAAYAHAVNAKSNVASFKAVEAALTPKETAKDDKPPISDGVKSILQAIPVGTTLVIGSGAALEGVGEAGHECSDTGDPLAAGREENITLKVVPPEHDKSVHGVFEGSDTAKRLAISDSPVALEDADNNNGRADLDSA